MEVQSHYLAVKLIVPVAFGEPQKSYDPEARVSSIIYRKVSDFDESQRASFKQWVTNPETACPLKDNEHFGILLQELTVFVPPCRHRKTVKNDDGSKTCVKCGIVLRI